MGKIKELDLQQLVDEISKTYFHKPFIDEVCFNKRLRTTGGRYIPSKRKIELNPKYLEELGYDELEGIIKHELCHYHLHIEGKGYKHRDKEFRDLLKKTNSPRHCRMLPSMENDYTYQYECISCGQLYNRKRRVNTTKYRCGKCRGKLKFVQ
ncbi:SprT-like protein [Gracilibacillus halotolerans]|uniref:Protein SprT-like n=1 Tax=Gracilibacillus halotolerans TaxID=74386 RepID=A0A841RMI6_9BACI|nr:SprT family protein [Gracilibacillus halotolerans]MBB6513087.1 SprT-like protein [Gracilibacillus halotolerans]